MSAWLALPFVLVAAFWIAARVERRDGASFWRQNGAAVGVYLLVAIGLWALLLVALPEISMVELSFRPKLPPSAVGGPRDVYTLANYRYFLFGSASSTSAWNATHLRAFATTIGASVAVTALDLVLCYPLAFVLAKVARGPGLRLLLLLLIAPYWVNEVLRAFALKVLFGPVIVPDLPSMVEEVLDGVDGFLFEAGNDEALQDVLRRAVAALPKVRGRMRVAARAAIAGRTFPGLAAALANAVETSMPLRRAA